MDFVPHGAIICEGSKRKSSVEIILIEEPDGPRA